MSTSTEADTDRPRTLTAGSAALIFLAYIFAQVILAVLLYGIGGDRLGPLSDFLFPIVGIIAMVSTARVLIPDDLKKTGPTGLAWTFGGWDGVMKGLVIGSFFGLWSFILSKVYHPHPIHSHEPTEPIFNMVVTPGIQQLAAIAVLVLLAPVSEEMMFRGVLYGGCRKSLGPILAAVITTGIFVAIHFPYYIYAPFEIVLYIAIAIALLWCRLNWNAIGPAIAAHGGFNLIAAVVPSLIFTWQHSCYESGVAEYKASNFNQAIASLTHAIQLGDQSSSVYSYRGSAKLENGDLDGAISDYDIAILQNPKDTTDFYNRGLAKQRNADFEHAIADFDEAIALNPRDVEAYDHRATAERDLKQYDKAISDYDRAIEIDPNDYSAFLDRGISEADSGDPEKAIVDYLHAARLNPTNSYAFHELGVADCQILNFKEATACLTHAIELGDKSSRAYVDRGIAEDRGGDVDGAISDYTKAINLEPQDGVAFYDRGLAKCEKADLEGAVADYDEAITLDRRDSEAYDDRGLAKNSEGKLEDAMSDFNTAIELNPTNSLYYNNRGWTEFLKGDFNSSITDATRSIRLDPNAGYAYGTRGWARYRIGDVSGAVEDCQKATHLFKPGSADFLHDQGMLDFIAKDYTQAIADWQKAIEQDPTLKNELLPWVEKAQKALGANVPVRS